VGVATGDASDRRLHSETVSNSSTRASPLPSVVTEPARSLAAHARRSLSSRSLAAPCSYARNVSFRAHLARPKTRDVCTGKLGAARYERGWGDPRFTTRLSLWRPGGALLEALSSSERVRNPTASGVPVASSFPLAWARVSSSRKRWSGGRQDRFCGGLVKGVRFTDPGRLPPVAASRGALAPKHERARVASLEDAALT